MLKINILLVFLGFLINDYAQKKEIDHTAYNDWKRVSNESISKSGEFLAYEINPHRGDGKLTFKNLTTGNERIFDRSVNPQFSNQENFLCFIIKPGFDTLRKLELAKVDKKKWPQDTLGIYLISKDTLIKVANYKSYQLAKETDLLAYVTNDNEIETPIEKISFWQKIKNIIKKPIEIILPESDGQHLTMLDSEGKKIEEFKDVTDFQLSENGKVAVLTKQLKIKEKDKSTDSVWLYIWKDGQDDIQTSFKANSFKSVNFSNNQNMLTFLVSNDTNKTKQYALGTLNISTGDFKIIADSASNIFGQGKSVSDFRSPVFSNDDKLIFFGVADKPKVEKKDTLTDLEDVNVDIWSWKDDRLQPQQLVEAKRDARKNHLYTYNLLDSKFVQIGNDTLQTDFEQSEDVNPEYIFAYNDKPYSSAANWTFPNLSDHYRINLETGKPDLLMKGVGFGGTLSPKGMHYIYFNREDLNQYHVDLKTKQSTCITCQEKTVLWLSDNNGMPFEPAPEGLAGWLNDESGVIIESENDIWLYTFADKKLSSLSYKLGLNKKIKLKLQTITKDSVYVYLDKAFLIGMDRKTRERTIFLHDGVFYSPKYSSPHEILNFHWNEEKDVITYRKQSNKDFPDLYLNNFGFTGEQKITTANPQQEEYNWSTVEQVSWYSYDSILLEGLLYKPENFDATKSYPLMVYFYELYSDEIHNHYAPRPTASIIFPTEYASAGYVVFIPDIRYRAGHPAQSAYNCIMSGTDKVLSLYPNIDSNRMALQGQSWGGYQTAQLITMTDRYKAGMAGAPVANMFSAYGGIRWNSGLNRAFQYEKTQSRIGKTIWESPELYIENSPLFHLPNVQTPLLIMHNDADGSVPWYQGIELFTGLKRLEKPVWMLNYNGDDHNLMKNANRMDLSIRMRQFFDYYLLNKPEPEWMKSGLPAIEKGKTLAY